jgi:hypothetical protein
MNRARPPSQRKHTACSGCHLTRDHSAATTRGVGVISPTRAVIRGTPSPITLYGKSRPTENDLFGDRTSRFNHQHEEGGGRPGSLWEIVTATSWLPRQPGLSG